MKKTFGLIGSALFTVLACLNLASCTNEEIVPEKPATEKYITVGLNCVGEFLEVSNSPLAKAAGDDLYYIQVYSLTKKDYEGKEPYYEETPYANGTFETSLDDITIKLLEGAMYKFKVGIVVGASYGSGGAIIYRREFDYNVNYSNEPSMYIGRQSEAFYGELDRFVPVEGQGVSIPTKRVSYGANFVAEDLAEGTLEIAVSNGIYNQLYKVSLTPDNPVSDKIYSFSSVYNAWKGIAVPTDTYDPETGMHIYEYVNYYNEKTISIKWIKSTDNVVPLGTYNVTYHRNVRTTVKIKAEELSTSNGITVTKETSPITDDTKEYQIEGGKVVEVPLS